MIIKNKLLKIFIAYIFRRMIVIHQFFYGIYVRLIKKKNSPLVFCIGFGKTGTSSLDKALSILGYRNIHWLRAHLKPKKGWIEYIRKSPFDAFSDAPIFSKGFFRELDKEFPGSKFILTIRKPEALIKSWMNYFVNAPWSIDTEEDKKKLIRRYKTHSNEVIEYFKDKPSQLLIMDIIGGDGWEKLCNFLEKPVPDVPFPLKRVGKYKKKTKK